MTTENASDHPLVSVVIPLYNGGRFIESTICSILAQSYQWYEILVVDDCSSDDGPAKVLSLAKNHPSRIRLLSHSDRANHGIAASRNLGIRSAQGSFIAFIDQDDLWVPQKLQKQIDLLQQFPEASIVYAKAGFIDERGDGRTFDGRYSSYGQGVPGKTRNVFRQLINEDFIPNLTVVVRKTSLERVGLLDVGPRYEYEDWLLLTKLAYFYDFLFVPEVLAKWRLHGGNYSAKIFRTGQSSWAEEHCTIVLFSYILNDPEAVPSEVRGYLRRRIWRLLLRARSWGAGTELLTEHASNLKNAFPSEQLAIHMALWTSLILPRALASALRRIRRKLVGI